MQIGKTGIVGAGTMGSSIAVALVSRGYPVILKDKNEDCLRAGIGRVDRLLGSQITRGLPREEAAAMRNLIAPTTDYSAFAELDFVIEAVSEDIELKATVLQELDECCNVNAILATNTSSLAVSRLAARTRRPDKVVGMHFFNPAHLMKLVEVISGLDTSADTIHTVIDFAQRIGKLAIRVDECPSFLVNRLLGRFLNESVWCLNETDISIEDLDSAACSYAMSIGPLALRDKIGLDAGLSVSEFNFKEYGERFRPARLLEAMVKENLLGQKLGRGFYLYDSQTRKKTTANPQVKEIMAQLNGSAASRQPFQVERLFLPMINEAFLALQEKVCEAADLDLALMSALGMQKGPLAIASEIGLAECLKEIEALFDSLGERFRPAPLLKRYVWARRTVMM